MSIRSGPASGTRQFVRRLSEVNLSVPNDALYGPNGANAADDAVQMYLNEQYNASRPLSPSLSMYQEAYIAPNASQNASNVEITLNNGIDARATTSAVSGANEAGFAAILAAFDRLSCKVDDKVTLVATNAEHLKVQMQQCNMQQTEMQNRLNDLAAQLQALQNAPQNAMAISAPMHANALCINEDATEEAGANQVPIEPNAQIGYEEAQNAQIGITGAMQMNAVSAGGNGTQMQNAMQNANALQGTDSQTMHFDAMQNYNGGNGRANMPAMMQNAVQPVATVLRAPVLPNAAAMPPNAAVMHQMQTNGGGANYNATTQSLQMQNATLNADAYQPMQNNALQMPMQPLHAQQQHMQQPHNYRAAAGQVHGQNIYHMGSPEAPAAAPLAALKAARRPEPFDGKKRTLQAQLWLNTMTTFINAVPNEQQLSVAATYLTGRAQEWYGCAGKNMHTYAHFCHAFVNRFVDNTMQEEAPQRLAILRQTGSVHSYNAIFETTLQMADMTPEDKMTAIYYVQGLEPQLQERVREHLDLRGVAGSYYAARQAADKLNGYRRLSYANRQGGRHSQTANGMQNDDADLNAVNDSVPGGRGRGRGGFRGRGSGRSGAARIPYEQRLCYECNQPGHIAFHCPNRQQARAQQPAQAPQVRAEQQQQAAAADANAQQNLN